MQVGLQMFTVRNSFAKDPINTLKEISRIGYKNIEMANHNAYEDVGTGVGLSLEEFKSAIEEFGLNVVGAHILPADGAKNIDPFFRDYDHYKKIIEFYQAVGAKHLSIPIDFFPTKDYLLKRCESYNKLGELCADAGIKLLYHNHYNEFQRLNGEYMMDLILDNTDPKYLGVELDAYWMIRGLFNPCDKIRELGDRLCLLHEKDFPLSQIDNLNAWKVIDQDVPCDYVSFHSATDPKYFIEIGEGIIKIQDVIDTGNEFNVPYILLEQDYTTMTELDSIAKSIANFKKMRALEW